MTFILFMKQVYFWLSVMLKLKLAANFNMTTKNYFVVDCIHNIGFIDFVFFGEWMNKSIFIYFTCICINMKLCHNAHVFFSFSIC